MKKITRLEFLSILFNIFIGAILLIDAIKSGSNGYIYAAVVCLIASFIAGLCAQRGHEITKLNQEYAEINHQRLQATKERDEYNQELSQLRQKYSRTNQPRSGERFSKNPITPVLPISLEDQCKSNLGKEVKSEMSRGDVSILCGYSPYYNCMIFGLNSTGGWTDLGEHDIILKEYKSYEYGRL